jgi:hypothetical protein
MTENRQKILNNCIIFFGFEAPQTIELFAISERCPEEQFDDALRIIYLARVDEYEAEHQFWDEEDETSVPIDYSDESGFDPYMGCYTGDC